MPEPNSPLWSAVRTIDDVWPRDDEVVALDLASAWGRGADTVTLAASATSSAGADAVASWQDPVGAAFGDEVNEFTEAASRLDQSMRAVGMRPEHYGRELTSAKSIITNTIAANENTYALLGNPLLGALGPQLQRAFAVRVANDLRTMIDAKAAGLRGDPATRPAEVAAEDDGNILGNLLRGLGDLNMNTALAVGEFMDDASDVSGDLLGSLLAGVGLHDAGRSVQQWADEDGNRVAENWLQLGATVRNFDYDLAQGVDGADKPRVVYISRERYPEAAEHIDDAKAGRIWDGFTWNYGNPMPSELTVDRDGAEARRDAATSRLWSLWPDYDRDEYPPAVAKEGDKGSSVRYIDPSDNRGAGSTMGHQLNGRTRSIERQLGGGPLGYGRADEDDKFTLETFG